MKFLSTIREFTSLIFNISAGGNAGKDIEIKPASKSSNDSEAEVVYSIPDTTVGTDVTPHTDTFVLENETQTLSNKTLVSPKMNEIIETSSSDVYSLPNIAGSDTLVSRTSTDTLGKKTLDLDDAIKLQTSTATYTLDHETWTSGNANIIFPNLGGVNDTIIFANISQTLTNKQLTSPGINEATALTATSTELNQLDGVTVGGNTLGDIVTIDGTQTLTNKTIDADLSTITNVGDEELKAGINANKIADGSVDNTEFQKLNTVGTNAAGEIVSTDGTQTLSGKTISDLNYDEANIALATNQIAYNAATIWHITGTAADVNNISGSPSDGDTRILINETGGTISLKNDFAAGGFYTGSGADLDILDNGTVQLVYESTVDRWHVIGGAGGGAGGLTLAVIADTDSPVTASANIHYLTKTTNDAIIVNLPAGGAGDVIRFTDADRTWHLNNVTLNPDGAETIDGQTSFILDVQDSWFQIMWDTTAGEWVSDDSLDPSTVDLTGDITTSNTVKADQGFLTKDSATLDYTVDAGCTLAHPFLTIEAGVTYTNNGSMVVSGVFQNNGTVQNNGTIHRN